MNVTRPGLTPINLREKLGLIDAFWAPKVIAELNDYQLKLVKLQGEFVWHRHDETDELFVCLSGTLLIELPDGAVRLGEGELFVVPKGVEHKPIADPECQLLLIEPRGVTNTGTAGGDRTAPHDAWI